MSVEAPHAPTHELNTVRPSVRAASVGLAKRNIRGIRRLPSAFLPSLVMPVFQAIAFSGSFFAITQIPLAIVEGHRVIGLLSEFDTLKWLLLHQK